MSDWSDGDYPTDAALEKIEAWPMSTFQDFDRLLEFVKPIWKYSDCGYWHEQEGKFIDGFPRSQPARVYLLSTGGWSGNESIVSALHEHLTFWMVCWYSSRRGGHYEFRVPREGVGSGEPTA